MEDILELRRWVDNKIEMDVKGFIEQKGQNCKCCGFWKVYGDEESSKMKFEQYRKCIEVYKKVFLQGRSLCQLTVSA